MLKQKHVDIIIICLKMMGAVGNKKSKADIKETLEAFNKDIKRTVQAQKDFDNYKMRRTGIQTVRPSDAPAPKGPGRQR